MSKKIKGVIAILVTLLVATIAFLCYTYAKDIGGTNNNNVQTTNTTNTNTASNRVEKVENNVNTVTDNTITNNTVENKVEKETKVEEPQIEVTSEVQDDSDEEKAIAIVKKDWGEAEGFAFRVEQINGDGSYVISVRNDDSIALEWYTVYPKTGKFSK